MAENITTKTRDFFDNNTPGGYIQTSVNISNSDLDERINQRIAEKGFLTSASELSWNKITDKPNFSTSAISGSYNDLNNKPNLFSGNYNDLSNKPNIPTISISNTLNEGTRLATITINGVDTDIYGSSNGSGNNSEIGEETDPIFLASPAYAITNNDIINWNNKSNFDATTLATIALTGDYNDLSNQPTIINNILFFSTIPCIDNNFKNLTSSSIIDATSNFDITEDSETIEDWLENISDTYFNNINQLIKIISMNNIYIIGNIILTNNVYTFSFLPLSTTNYNSIDKTNKTDSEILALIQSATSYKQIILDKNIHKIFIL